MDRDRGLCALGRGGQRYLGSRGQIARREHVSYARVEVLVDHDALLVVASAPQSLREVVGGEAADREKEALAVEDGAILELERLERAILVHGAPHARHEHRDVERVELAYCLVEIGVVPFVQMMMSRVHVVRLSAMPTAGVRCR